MNRARSSTLFASFLLLLAASPNSTAQARQPVPPLPELSVWKQEIAALPMDRKVIEAKREEFYALFKDRDVPTRVYDEYATILQGAFNALRVAEGRAGMLNSSSLLLGGLNIDDGNDARRLFLGEFSEVSLEPYSYRFDSFLLSYLLAYGQKCETRRPPQTVEIRVVRCTVTRETYNGFGTLIGSGCGSWERIGSNRFGDPALVAAQEKISQSLASKIPSQLAYTLGNPRSLLTLASEASSAKTAMEKLVANNECSSPGIRRFADNLLRFADGQPSLTMPGASPSGATAPTKSTLYSACMAERLSKGFQKDRWQEYCSCINRQYSPVLTAAERDKYIGDYEAFIREAINAEPGAPGFQWRLFTPQNACRN